MHSNFKLVPKHNDSFFLHLKFYLLVVGVFRFFYFKRKTFLDLQRVHEHGQTLSIANEVAAQTNFVFLFVWQHLSGGFPQRELGVWSIKKPPLSFP